MKQTISVDLVDPIEVHGIETRCITMRFPRVGDELAILDLAESDEMTEAKIFAELCNIPYKEFLEISRRDLMGLQEAYVELTIREPQEFGMTDNAKSIEIDLIDPIEVNGIKTQKLTMRFPKFRDELAVREFSGSDAAREVLLFSNLCDISVNDMRQVSKRDYGEIQSAYRALAQKKISAS